MILKGLALTTSMTRKAREALRNAPPDALVRIETFQDSEALATLIETGCLSGGSEYGDREETWKGAYEWMRERMARAVGGFSGDFPVWAWPRALRLSRKELEWKDGLWRIRALVPRRRILPSCFTLWHHPLNGLSIDEDEEAMAKNWHAPPEAKRATWHKALDIGERDPALAEFLGQPDVVQLCLDGLLLTEVYAVMPVSRRRRI